MKYLVICKLLRHRKATIAKPVRVISRTFALGLFALLAACAGTEDLSDASSSQPVSTTEAATPEVARIPPPEPKVPELAAPAPEALIGFKPVQLSETFGTASLVRRDLGAEIWQYRARECVLFLFLYTKSATETPNALSVHHIDVRGDQSPADCVKTIVREHKSRDQG